MNRFSVAVSLWAKVSRTDVWPRVRLPEPQLSMARRQHQQMVNALDKLKGEVVLIDTQLQVPPSSPLLSLLTTLCRDHQCERTQGRHEAI